MASKYRPKAQLNPAVEAAVRGEVGEAEVADIVEAFMRLAGGPQAVAKMMYDAYRHKDCSAMTRHRIMETILRGMKFREEMRGPREPDALASDEDLLREASRILQRLQKTSGEEQAGPG